MQKVILMIIAPEKFRDEEYTEPKTYFEEKGAKVITASSKTGECVGYFGTRAESTLLLKDVVVAKFDAVIFVGGMGSFGFIEDEQAHRIAQEAVKQNKLVGAICAAPRILAKAGVLRGKRATVFFSVDDHSGISFLKENGAEFVDQGVVVDGKIVTAQGPTYARQFAIEISKLLDLE